MIILGIDPGLATTGYGVIKEEGEALESLGYGCIKTKAGVEKTRRYCEIFDGIMEIMREFKPDILAVESLFFNKNTKTALMVGASLGIIFLAAGKFGIPLVEYTPLQVKECLTGFGRAKKNQIREIVQIELELEKPPTPIDASDALAIALCHYHLDEMDE
ncbi:MAG: crossover junction endodeoxyribonuclease RuvC [Candidatus Eremiobacteraeota bacterium]|nr:crossover junction endodeoxyribonuclease RuvC [Candidatus Eremiobacteraeota bacterium]